MSYFEQQAYSSPSWGRAIQQGYVNTRPVLNQPGREPAVVGRPPVLSQPRVVPRYDSYDYNNASGNSAANSNIAPNTFFIWTQDIFGCLDDCKICMSVAFCGLCVECQLSDDMGEFILLPCLAHLCMLNCAWLFAARTKVRMLLRIEGSMTDDFCMAVCCAPCALCQLKREIKLAKEHGRM